VLQMQKLFAGTSEFLAHSFVCHMIHP